MMYVVFILLLLPMKEPKNKNLFIWRPSEEIKILLGIEPPHLTWQIKYCFLFVLIRSSEYLNMLWTRPNTMAIFEIMSVIYTCDVYTTLSEIFNAI